MANVTVPYREEGLAAFEQLDNYGQSFLLSGDMPRLASAPMKLATDTVFKQFQVVGFDSDNNLVPAVYDADPADAIQAVAVITQAVDTTGKIGVTAPVFWSGCFDPDALVWDESFDTLDKKLEAFRGAPSPTQIIVRPRL